MTRTILCLAIIGLAAVFATALVRPVHTAEADAATFPTFEMKEIDKSLSVGYAVLLVDLNGDG